MNGFGGGETLVTLVAALVTLVVLGGMFGERRVFGWTQHLFAGLITGYLVLLAVSEVIIPRIGTVLLADPVGHPELWLAAILVALTAAAPWLPRVAAAVPLSVAIGSLAAFALGGAVVGTILPQLSAGVAAPGDDQVSALAAAGAAGITGLVLLGFLRGEPRGRIVGGAASAGRWLLLAGIGGWLGWLLYSRLILLVDRLSFLIGSWLGIGR